MGSENGSNAFPFYDDQLHNGIQWSRPGVGTYALPSPKTDLQIQHLRTVRNLYGIFLRISNVYGIFFSRRFAKTNASPVITKNAYQNETREKLTLTGCLKKACMENTQSLILLGGYVTFTNAFRIFLDFFRLSDNMKRVLSSFLEIMGGVQTIYTGTLPPQEKVLWIMTALSFGGISCLIQTSSFLEKAKLPLSSYLKNKTVITLISFGYYTLLLYIL